MLFPLHSSLFLSSDPDDSSFNRSIFQSGQTPVYRPRRITSGWQATIRKFAPDPVDGYKKLSARHKIWSPSKILAQTLSTVSVTLKRHHIKFWMLNARSLECSKKFRLIFRPGPADWLYPHRRTFLRYLAVYNVSLIQIWICPTVQDRYSTLGILLHTLLRATSTPPTPRLVRIASTQVTMPPLRRVVWQAVRPVGSSIWRHHRHLHTSEAVHSIPGLCWRMAGMNSHRSSIHNASGKWLICGKSSFPSPGSVTLPWRSLLSSLGVSLWQSSSSTGWLSQWPSRDRICSPCLFLSSGWSPSW